MNELLGNPESLTALKRNAYDYGLHLRYPKIGAEYIKVAQEAAAKHEIANKTLQHTIVDPEIMPRFSLDHVLRLTDDTGIVQHAKFGILI